MRSELSWSTSCEDRPVASTRTDCRIHDDRSDMFRTRGEMNSSCYIVPTLPFSETVSHDFPVFSFGSHSMSWGQDLLQAWESRRLQAPGFQDPSGDSSLKSLCTVWDLVVKPVFCRHATRSNGLRSKASTRKVSVALSRPKSGHLRDSDPDTPGKSAISISRCLMRSSPCLKVITNFGGHQPQRDPRSNNVSFRTDSESRCFSLYPGASTWVSKLITGDRRKIGNVVDDDDEK